MCKKDDSMIMKCIAAYKNPTSNMYKKVTWFISYFPLTSFIDEVFLFGELPSLDVLLYHTILRKNFQSLLCVKTPAYPQL